MVDFDQVAGGCSCEHQSWRSVRPAGDGGQDDGSGRLFSRPAGAAEQSGQTPLVCDRVGIVWVAGHRIAERVKATDQYRARCSSLRASGQKRDADGW